MKSRWLAYTMVAVLCALALINAFQADRYAIARTRLAQLEKQQNEWLTSNKQLIAGIAVLSAADRIDRLAKDELGLIKIRPEVVTHITIVAEGEIDG